MSVWLFFVLISRPIISSVPVFGLQRWFLFYEIASSFLRFSSILLGVFYAFNALSVVAIYSVCSAFIYAFLVFKMLRVAALFDQEK